MKHSLLLISILLLIVQISCTPSNNYRNGGSNYTLEAQTSAQEEPHTYDFAEYGFSVSAPCVFEDAPAQNKGKDLVNVGGFVNKGNRQNFTFYQLIVTEIRNRTEAEVLAFLKDRKGGLYNMKQTKIGGYNALEGDAVTQGVDTKGAFIIKTPYLIALTVISPVNLEQKYNDYKNSFTTIGESTVAPEPNLNTETDKKSDNRSQILDELIEKFGCNVGHNILDAKKSAKKENLTQFMEQQNNGYTATLFENGGHNTIVGYIHKKNIVSFIGIGFNSKTAMNAIFAELRTKVEYVGRSYYPLQVPKIEYPTYKYDGYYFQKFESEQGAMVIISKSVEMAY